MAIEVQCECGRRLKARDEFAGKRAECAFCGRTLAVPSIPSATVDAAVADRGGGEAAGAAIEEALEITEFLDPPGTPVVKKERAISLRRMFEALLDPRSIQWMLILGGGLAVLGLVIWLATRGIFKNPYILAGALGIGTLAILGTGWLVVLRARFRVAGQAVTFLGCVLAPLNLWFYHAQGLLTLDQRLWVGGVVCCLLYAATVYVLRDPLFMYAVEAGLTLTVGLLLAEWELIGDTFSLCVFLMALGLISIHAERAFPPREGAFPRERFGMPLFWSGHVQLGLALLILLGVQLAGWLLAPVQAFFGTQWQAEPSHWPLLAGGLLGGGLWLAGTYAYLYSDIVVRRVGVYTYLAAVCFLLAVVTVVRTSLYVEGLIAVLALVALAAIVVQTRVARGNEKLDRAVPPLAMVLSILPLLIGIGLHFRATSRLAVEANLQYETGWWFAAVMLLVFACNRIAAHLYRRTAPKWAGGYFFLCAAALIVAAAGVLRMTGVEEWAEQAPLLMLIPLGYMIASRLWRGQSPERPLYWAGQAATAVILIHVLGASQETLRSFARPLQGESTNLLLGLVFLEAAAFYFLATIFRRRGVNVYFAAAAACGALWQLLGYWALPGAYHMLIYAALGVGVLAIARGLGLEQAPVYKHTGGQVLATRGKGLPAFQTGNAIALVALLAAFLQGLTRLATHQIEWPSVAALVSTACASAAAACLVPKGGWRRLYAVAAIAIFGLAFLTAHGLIELSNWQKLEIFCVAAGIILVGASYVGRFRETAAKENEMVSIGLWLGSLLATVPLLVAVIYYHFSEAKFSLPDEIPLLSIAVLMLLTGYSWQIKSTTLFGGSSLFLYLVILIGSIGWQQREEAGVLAVVLAAIGTLIFACGLALSVYREKLLRLPQQIANREGIFQVIGWR